MRRLPAEWEPQSGIMLAWPHADTDWAPYLEAAERTCRDMVQAIAEREGVLILCRDEAHREGILSQLRSQATPLERVHIEIASYDDTWMRDYGPITIMEDRGPVLLDFTFNAWGGKYPHARDNAVTGTLASRGVFADTPLRKVDLVLEGGAIETDGQGTLLATRRSIICSHRNPSMDQTAIEARLAEEFGISHFLWLDHGALHGDDTDSHIDTLVRFSSPDALVYVACDDPSHPDYAELAAMHQELLALRTAAGEPYRLLALPAPPIIEDADGHQLPGSYANFLIINDDVLAPVYGDSQDSAALATLAQAFPQHRIVPVDCRALIEQHGSLHCMTMQLPASVSF